MPLLWNIWIRKDWDLFPYELDSFLRHIILLNCMNFNEILCSHISRHTQSKHIQFKLYYKLKQDLKIEKNIQHSLPTKSSHKHGSSIKDTFCYVLN